MAFDFLWVVSFQNKTPVPQGHEGNSNNKLLSVAARGYIFEKFLIIDIQYRF